MRTPPENPFESIEGTIALDSRDWATRSSDAWLYGIVCGWGDDDPEIDARDDIAKLHNWTPEAMARLDRLHAAWKRASLTEADQ